MVCSTQFMQLCRLHCFFHSLGHGGEEAIHLSVSSPLFVVSYGRLCRQELCLLNCSKDLFFYAKKRDAQTLARQVFVFVILCGVSALSVALSAVVDSYLEIAPQTQ